MIFRTGNHWFSISLCMFYPRLFRYINPLKSLWNRISPNEIRWNPYEIPIFLSWVTISLWFSCRCPMVFPSYCQDVAPQTSTSEGPKTSGERRLQHAKSTLDAARMMSPLNPSWALKPQQKKGFSPDKMVSYPFKMDKTWSFYPFKMDQKGHLTVQNGRKVGALGGLNKPKCLCLTLFGTPQKSLVYHNVS